MKPIRNSAKAVVIEDGRLLANRHVDAQGPWFSLPGGGQRAGEPLLDALRREVLEETGFEVEVGDLRFVREYIGRNHEFAEHDADVHQVELMFQCRLSRVRPRLEPTDPDERQVGVEWLPLADLAERRLYPSVLAEHLRDGLPPAEGPVYLGDVN
jgi:ADP-ribose pyrophosphatase YjhB (NUDIX family)